MFIFVVYFVKYEKFYLNSLFFMLVRVLVFSVIFGVAILVLFELVRVLVFLFLL